VYRADDLSNAVAAANFDFMFTMDTTKPAGNQPTFNQFILNSPQSTLPIQINMTLTPSTIVAGSYSNTVIFTASDPQGVVWRTQCTTTTGVCGSDQWSDPVWMMGAFTCPNVFASSSVASGQGFQKDTPLNVGSIIIGLSPNSGQSFFGPSAVSGNTNLVVHSGTNDHTAPSCSSAVWSTNTVNVDTTTSVTFTPTCTDNSGGVGLNHVGVFYRLTRGTYTLDLEKGVDAISVLDIAVPTPAHYSGTIDVLGFYAIDEAGNAVLYGSCGGQAQYWTSLCGGGSSSAALALVASFYSLVIVVAAASLAL